MEPGSCVVIDLDIVLGYSYSWRVQKAILAVVWVGLSSRGCEEKERRGEGRKLAKRPP